MHKLEIYQSLWAMEQRQADLPEPSADDNFARIAEAGYHGVCLDPDISEIDDCLALASAVRALRSGLHDQCVPVHG
jgi:hypothetical protein